MAPYGSRASASSAAAGPGTGATVPDSADGTTFSFFSAGGGVAGGVGGAAAAFLLSSEPTCNCDLYFLRMLSLWYFQNCFEASLPATLCKTTRSLEGDPLGFLHVRLTLLATCKMSAGNIAVRRQSAYQDVLLEIWSNRRHLHQR